MFRSDQQRSVAIRSDQQRSQERDSPGVWRPWRRYVQAGESKEKKR